MARDAIEIVGEEAAQCLANQESRATSLKLFATVLATAVPAIGVAALATNGGSHTWRQCDVLGLIVLAVAVAGVFGLDTRGIVDPMEIARQSSHLDEEQLARYVTQVKLGLYRANGPALTRSAGALAAAGLAAAVVLVAAAKLLSV